MPGAVRVRILDLTGARSLEATVEGETPTGELIRRVAARLGYPAVQVGGRPLHYRLFHREGKALIPPEAAIPEAGVGEGDTLVILPAPGEGGEA